jgi:hypothetical protein
MCEPAGFVAPAGRACATTNPAGWIFGRFFFVPFFCRQKKGKKKINNIQALKKHILYIINNQTYSKM